MTIIVEFSAYIHKFRIKKKHDKIIIELFFFCQDFFSLEDPDVQCSIVCIKQVLIQKNKRFCTPWLKTSQSKVIHLNTPKPQTVNQVSMKSCFVLMGVFKIGRVLYTKRKFSSCSALEPQWRQKFSEVGF